MRVWRMPLSSSGSCWISNLRSCLVACACACGGSPDCTTGGARNDCPANLDAWDGSADLGSDDESALPEPEPLAAFMAPERVEYRDRQGPHQSPAARVFYSFFPAIEGAREKP